MPGLCVNDPSYIPQLSDPRYVARYPQTLFCKFVTFWKNGFSVFLTYFFTTGTYLHFLRYASL